MTYKKVVFYNHFGAGDIFESREFVKEVCQIIPAEEYFYAHPKNPRMLVDIEYLKHTPVTDIMKPTRAFTKDRSELYINTWIGRDGKYVLPQVGCVADKNWEMYNDVLKKLGARKLSKGHLEYLPDPNCNFFNLKHVDQYLIETAGSRKVLICNGVVNSNQAFNFDFSEPIFEVARNNPKVNFIVTQTPPVNLGNIRTIASIVQSPDGYDLNETSYLAEFCQVIVGRKSGPFVFAHTKKVWHDGTKKSLSFTYAKHSSHFVREDTLPLRKFWSPTTEKKEIIKRMEEVISG